MIFIDFKERMRNTSILFVVLWAFALSPQCFGADDFCRGIEESSALYLDPQGTKVISTKSSQFEVRLRCETKHEQLSHLGSVVPKVCEPYADPKPQAATSVAFELLNWDPRRCLSTSAVSQFKHALSQALSHSAEMPKFFSILNASCFQNEVLFSKYSCLSLNAENFFKKARVAALALENRTQTTIRDTCALFHNQGFRSDEIEFLAATANDQKRPQGLSPKEYPLYENCSKSGLSTVFRACQQPEKNDSFLNQSLSQKQMNCLKGALRTYSEDTETFHKNALSNVGHVAMLRLFSELQEAALEVSVFSRLCHSGLEFKSLTQEGIRDQKDELTKNRCLTQEVNRLKEISNWSDWIRKQKNQNSKNNLELAKELGCLPKLDVAQEKLEKQASEIMRITADSSFEEPQDLKPSAKDAKIDSKEKVRKAIQEKIQSTFAKKLSDPKLNSSQKNTISRLSKDKKYLDNLERNYELQFEKDPSQNLSANLRMVEHSLSSGIDRLFNPTASKLASQNKSQSSHQKAGAPTADLAEENSKTDNDSEDVPAKTRPRGRILEEFSQAIDDFKNKKANKIDLANTLLELEASDSTESEKPITEISYQMLKEQWTQDTQSTQERLAKEPTSDEKIKKLIELLKKETLKEAAPNQPLLSATLLGSTPDTKGQIKFVWSTLKSLGLDQDKNLKFAVQATLKNGRPAYEPVIYDQEKKEVWNLSNGEKTLEKELKVPVYHPEILYKTLLEEHRVEAAIKNKDLLLVSPMSEPHETIDYGKPLSSEAQARYALERFKSTVNKPEKKSDPNANKSKSSFSVFDLLKLQDLLPSDFSFTDAIKALELLPEGTSISDALKFLSENKDWIKTVSKKLPDGVSMREALAALKKQNKIPKNTDLLDAMKYLRENKEKLQVMSDEEADLFKDFDWKSLKPEPAQPKKKTEEKPKEDSLQQSTYYVGSALSLEDIETYHDLTETDVKALKALKELRVGTPYDFYFTSKRSSFFTSEKIVAYFRTNEMRDTYLKLKSEQERALFLVQSHVKRGNYMAKQKPYKDIEKMLENVSTVQDFSAEELSQMHRYYASTLSDFHKSAGFFEALISLDSLKPKITRKVLLKQWPHVQENADRALKLQAQLKSHPELLTQVLLKKKDFQETRVVLGLLNSIFILSKELQESGSVDLKKLTSLDKDYLEALADPKHWQYLREKQAFVPVEESQKISESASNDKKASRPVRKSEVGILRQNQTQEVEKGLGRESSKDVKVQEEVKEKKSIQEVLSLEPEEPSLGQASSREQKLSDEKPGKKNPLLLSKPEPAKVEGPYLQYAWVLFTAMDLIPDETSKQKLGARWTPELSYAVRRYYDQRRLALNVSGLIYPICKARQKAANSSVPILNLKFGDCPMPPDLALLLQDQVKAIRVNSPRDMFIVNLKSNIHAFKDLPAEEVSRFVEELEKLKLPTK